MCVFIRNADSLAKETPEIFCDLWERFGVDDSTGRHVRISFAMAPPCQQFSSKFFIFISSKPVLATLLTDSLVSFLCGESTLPFVKTISDFAFYFILHGMKFSLLNSSIFWSNYFIYYDAK